jgi:hypothetical protein
MLLKHSCSRIVPDWCPQHEASKGNPNTRLNEDFIQMMSMKNIVFTFLFRSPDQETCPGFTHPSNYLGITFGFMRFYCTF